MDQGKYPREAVENLTEIIEASLIEAILSDNIDKMLQHLNFKKKTIPERKYFNQTIDSDDELLPLNLETAIPSSKEMMVTVK